MPGEAFLTGLALRFALPLLFAASTWSTTGPPGPPNGLAFDPQDASRAYATSAEGVRRSFDGGKSWELSLRGEASHLVIAASDPSILYAITSGGLARSADRGDSWTLSPVPSSASQDLAVDPRDPNVLYATGYFTVAPQFLSGDFVTSHDGGQTWTTIVQTGIGSPPLLLVAAGEGAVYAVFSAGFVSRTEDSGRTWTDLPLVFPTNDSDSVLALASDDSGLYAFGFFSTYRSRDSGNPWSVVRPSPQLGISAFVAVHGFLIAAGSQGVFRSIEGANWENVLPKKATAAAIAPDGSTVLAGAGTGVWRSENGGESFAQTSARFLGSLFVRLERDRAGLVYAIPVFAGETVFRRSGSGLWEEFSVLPSTGAFAFAPLNPAIQYAVAYSPEDPCPPLQKTIDSGKTWLSTGPRLCAVDRMAVDPNDSNRLIVAAASGLYVSTDGGRFLLRTFLPPDIPVQIPIVFDGARPGRVYVGFSSSADGGLTWTSDVTAAFCGGSVLFCQAESLAIDERSGAVYGLRRGGLMQRLNFGGGWSALPAAGAPFIRDIAVDSSTGDLVAGTAAGVFRSRDGGLHFEPVSPETLSSEVNSVLVRPGDGALFAAAGGLVWELGATITRDAPVPAPRRSTPRVVPPRRNPGQPAASEAVDRRGRD